MHHLSVVPVFGAGRDGPRTEYHLTSFQKKVLRMTDAPFNRHSKIRGLSAVRYRWLKRVSFWSIIFTRPQAGGSFTAAERLYRG